MTNRTFLERARQVGDLSYLRELEEKGSISTNLALFSQKCWPELIALVEAAEALRATCRSTVEEDIADVLERVDALDQKAGE